MGSERHPHAALHTITFLFRFRNSKSGGCLRGANARLIIKIILSLWLQLQWERVLSTLLEVALWSVQRLLILINVSSFIKPCYWSNLFNNCLWRKDSGILKLHASASIKGSDANFRKFPFLLKPPMLHPSLLWEGCSRKEEAGKFALGSLPLLLDY